MMKRMPSQSDRQDATIGGNETIESCCFGSVTNGAGRRGGHSGLPPPVIEQSPMQESHP